MLFSGKNVADVAVVSLSEVRMYSLGLDLAGSALRYSDVLTVTEVVYTNNVDRENDEKTKPTNKQRW